MKITNIQPADNARQSRMATPDSAAAHDHSAAAAVDPVALAAESRDFASVLKSVTRPDDDHGNSADDEDRFESRRDTSPEQSSTRRAREAQRHERAGDDKKISAASEKHDADDDDHASLAEHTGVNPEAFVPHEQRTAVEDSAISGVRSILHIVDLERMVAAARAQVLPGGRQEVTLELSRSVLEGLRVKLSRNPQGQISAEFIAATERTKSQLDVRTLELADLLRSRGIAIAELRTTIGGSATDAGGQEQANGDASQHDRRRMFPETFRDLPSSAERARGEAIRAAARVDDEEVVTGSTYRA